MEGILADIYKQNTKIIAKLDIAHELCNRIEILENILLNQDLTKQQAAEFLNCSVRTIERATTNGDISHTRIGKKIYYPKKGLLEFKESRTFRS